VTTYPPNDKHVRAFKRAERRAREQNLGLWVRAEYELPPPREDDIRSPGSLRPCFLDELERRPRQQLDALGPAPRAELPHVLMLPELERAERIGEFCPTRRAEPLPRSDRLRGGSEAQGGAGRDAAGDRRQVGQGGRPVIAPRRRLRVPAISSRALARL
jgi:hypothetical protein